jgi:hypothetical protein
MGNFHGIYSNVEFITRYLNRIFDITLQVEPVFVSDSYEFWLDGMSDEERVRISTTDLNSLIGHELAFKLIDELYLEVTDQIKDKMRVSGTDYHQSLIMIDDLMPRG